MSAQPKSLQGTPAQPKSSQGTPAVLAHYLPSTHGVRSLEDLSEIFLTTHSRILAESNTRDMDFIVKEKELRLNYDDAIRDMEQKCQEMQEQLHQLLYQRESALHILRSDRSTYQEEVKTRLLMLDIWLRDQRKLFNERQAQKKEVEP